MAPLCSRSSVINMRVIARAHFAVNPYATKQFPGRRRPSWIFRQFFQQPKVDHYHCLQITIPPNVMEFRQAVFRHEPKPILDKMVARWRSRQQSKIVSMSTVDHYHCLQSHQISWNSVKQFSVTSQNRFWTKWPPGGVLGEN